MRAYLTLLRVEIARFTLDETGVSSRGRALRRATRPMPGLFLSIETLKNPLARLLQLFLSIETLKAPLARRFLRPDSSLLL